MGKSYGKGYNDGLKDAKKHNVIKIICSAVVGLGVGFVTALLNQNKKAN